MSVQIEAGTLKASRSERTVSGLLLPYNERCTSSIGRFEVPKGAFKIPEDPSVITLNLQHDSHEPIGRATSLEDTDAGVVATFSVAKTPEGDAYLDEVESGTRNALSAEVKRVVVKLGKAVSGALFGAAAVTEGAFPSATLLAEYADEAPDEIEVEGVRYVKAPDELQDPATEPEPAVAEQIPEEINVTDPTAAEETLAAARPASLGGKAKAASKTLFASLASTPRHEYATLLAALDNVTAADALPAQQKQWLDEIWSKRTHVQKFAPLVQHDDLTGLTAIGWKFTKGKTPTVGDYAGFPNQPQSTEITTEAVNLTAARLAGAAAFDRAFVDFNVPGFWAGIAREWSNDYSRKFDRKVRDGMLTAATEVVAETVPSGVPTALSYIVDGFASIVGADDEDTFSPTFAVLGFDLWRGLALTRAEDASAYLTATLGLKEGDLDGFRITYSTASALAGKALVGSREAFTAYELPGSPVRVDVANIATGGVEQGVFGYYATLANNADGLALVGEDEG